MLKTRVKFQSGYSFLKKWKEKVPHKRKIFSSRIRLGEKRSEKSLKTETSKQHQQQQVIEFVKLRGWGPLKFDSQGKFLKRGRRSGSLLVIGVFRTMKRARIVLRRTGEPVFEQLLRVERKFQNKFALAFLPPGPESLVCCYATSVLSTVTSLFRGDFRVLFFSF